MTLPENSKIFLINIVLLQYSNTMKSQINSSSSKLQQEIKQIYQILIKYAFPPFISSNLLQDIQTIQIFMNDYLQPNTKRQHLIEWLILNINPLYSGQIQLKNNKKRKILNHLWKLGVLPYTKHTHNLDYQKYIEGLLGYQSSINLIHNLCILLKESNQYSKSKQDNKFSPFLQEIINNYDALINLDYDPYNISFPPAYTTLPQQSFNFQYQNTIKSILSKQTIQKQNQIAGTMIEENIYQKMIKQFEESKQEFQNKYHQFIQKISQTITKNSAFIQNSSNFKQNERKPLNISPNLSKIYRHYKQQIKIHRTTPSPLNHQRKHIQNLIQSLNETTSL